MTRPITVILACVALIPLAGACKKQLTLTLTLPSAYAGSVTVNCATVEERDIQANIGADGQAQVACPSQSPAMPAIHVYRDGKEIPVADARWLTTGDGILTELTFKVNSK
jgi:hypothetical protein